MILFVVKKITRFPRFSHILLYMLLDDKELVPNIFLKSTHELSQNYLTCFNHIASKTIITIIYEASVTFSVIQIDYVSECVVIYQLLPG